MPSPYNRTQGIRKPSPHCHGGVQPRTAKARLHAAPRLAVVAFTKAQIRDLVYALPAYINAHRRRLLPRVLKEWSRTDLNEHLTRPTPRQIRAEHRQLEKIGRTARDLAQALAAIADNGRFTIACQLLAPRSDFFTNRLKYEDVCEAERRLQEEPNRLQQLATAADEASAHFVPLPFRQSTLLRYLILQDLAAIFEWAMRQHAGRRVKTDIGDDAGETYGPFWEFASATWRIVFGSTKGLDNALKQWAQARRSYGEQSAVIANLHMRHPEWRIWDTNASSSTIGHG
jgi:hypothetical protein